MMRWKRDAVMSVLLGRADNGVCWVDRIGIVYLFLLHSKLLAKVYIFYLLSGSGILFQGTPSSVILPCSRNT